ANAPGPVKLVPPRRLAPCTYVAGHCLAESPTNLSRTWSSPRWHSVPQGHFGSDLAYCLAARNATISRANPLIRRRLAESVEKASALAHLRRFDHNRAIWPAIGLAHGSPRNQRTQLLQRLLHPLRFLENAGEEVAGAFESAQHVANVELLRLQSGTDFVPVERCGHWRPRIRSQDVRRGDGLSFR